MKHLIYNEFMQLAFDFNRHHWFFNLSVFLWVYFKFFFDYFYSTNVYRSNIFPIYLFVTERDNPLNMNIFYIVRYKLWKLMFYATVEFIFFHKKKTKYITKLHNRVIFPWWDSCLLRRNKTKNSFRNFFLIY